VIQLVKRNLQKFHSFRVIPLNPAAFEALLKWAGRFPNAEPTHYVFPWSDEGRVDPTRPTNGWRTAWEKARKRAGVNLRFHDLRVTCITKLAEGQASDQTIKAIAGHVSQRMLEHYSRIRMDAKRRALDALAQPLKPGVFEVDVHQNGNQVEGAVSQTAAKLLN
jgi:integrase